jgi:hypothetical protein
LYLDPALAAPETTEEMRLDAPLVPIYDEELSELLRDAGQGCKAQRSSRTAGLTQTGCCTR